MTDARNVVLLVDDHPQKLKLTQYSLERAGFTVLTTDSGREALRIAEFDRPDIIVSDIRMPEMDGYALCHELRQNPDLRETPVVLYSGYELTDEVESRANAAGATAVVTSSFNIKALVDKIRSLLEPPLPPAA